MCLKQLSGIFTVLCVLRLSVIVRLMEKLVFIFIVIFNCGFRRERGGLLRDREYILEECCTNNENEDEVSKIYLNRYKKRTKK